MKILRFMMWLGCLAINLLGIVAMLKMGRTPGAIYAGFVILALALNPPSVSLHGILTSQPVMLMQWLWRQGTGRAGNSAVS